jgi:hypothetical protein
MVLPAFELLETIAARTPVMPIGNGYVYSEVFDLKPTSGRRELKHSSTQEVKNGGCKVFDLEITGGYARVHEPGS